MLKLVCRHERSKKLHSVYQESEKFEKEFNIERIPMEENEQDLTATAIAKKVKTTAKNNAQKQFADR